MDYFKHDSAIVDEGAQVGAGSKIWHFSHIMPGAIIGEGCNIGQNVFIASKVVLGKNNKIQNNVSLYEGLLTENDVFLGPSAVFTNVINPRSAVVRKSEYQKTILKKGVSIGANATIVCGITIGSYAFVGAGAVVVKDVLDFALIVGNPAKQIGWMSRAGYRLEFDDAGNAICPGTGEKYLVKEEQCSIV